MWTWNPARQAEERERGKKTIAEVLIERGVLKGNLEAQLRQLCKRFGKLPAGIEAQVKGARYDAKLDRWLDEALTAEALTEMSFPAES